MVFGSDAVSRSIQAGRAMLVLVSKDAGDATVRRFVGECSRFAVPLVRAGDRAGLGRVVGKNAVSVLAVTDSSMATAILAKLGMEESQVLRGDRNRQGGS
ncbi:MAG: ribosomal L7Ae/L30e/S12e/Gadd45 family protein [Bacillota bacterium]